MDFGEILKELVKNERIELLEKRVAELESQVQVQPKEKFIPEDSNVKHYNRSGKTHMERPDIDC